MKDKQVYNRLRAEATLPVQADSRKLLSALNLPIPEEQPVKAKKRRWIPAAALCCTAAVAIAVCVPVYLNMQGNHGVVGGVTSSAPQEKKKLVWSMGGGTGHEDCVYYIAWDLQKAMDVPANEGKLFCVSVDLGYIEDDKIDKSFKYEGKTMDEWTELENQYVKQRDILDYEKQHQMDFKDYAAQREVLDQIINYYVGQYYKTRDAAYENARQKALVKAEQLYQDLGIKKENFVYSGSDPLHSGLFQAYLTKEQIEILGNAEECRHQIHLTIPARPEGYSRRIADSLVAMLEYEPQETYFVRVNSVLCKQTTYGNENYNADLIRELKDEEITQKFGDNFLADIRKRHGIEDAYVPPIEKYPGDWEVSSYTLDNGETGKAYFGGFFEAKLTRKEILELAQDSDVRSIYPALSEYEYNKPSEA